MDLYSKYGSSSFNGLNRMGGSGIPDDKKKRNYKLVVDPALKQGPQKIYRFDGNIPGDPTPILVRDPRSRMKRFWSQRELMNLPVPKFTYDENYVGTILPKEVTFTNLNDNINQKFLEDMVKTIGIVEECKIYYHPKTKKHTGIAKVSFTSTKAARICAEKFNNTSKMGKVMTVYVDLMGKERQRVLDDLTCERPRFRPPSPETPKKKFHDPRFERDKDRHGFNSAPRPPIKEERFPHTPGSSDLGYGGSLSDLTYSVGQSDGSSFPGTPHTPHTPRTPHPVGGGYQDGFNHGQFGMQQHGIGAFMGNQQSGGSHSQSSFSGGFDDHHHGYDSSQPPPPSYDSGSGYGQFGQQQSLSRKERDRRDRHRDSRDGEWRRHRRERRDSESDRDWHRDRDRKRDRDRYSSRDHYRDSNDGRDARDRSDRDRRFQSPPPPIPPAPRVPSPEPERPKPSLESRIASLLQMGNSDSCAPFSSPGNDSQDSCNEREMGMYVNSNSEAPPLPPEAPPPLPCQEAPLPPAEEPPPPPLPPEPEEDHLIVPKQEPWLPPQPDYSYNCDNSIHSLDQSIRSELGQSIKSEPEEFDPSSMSQTPFLDNSETRDDYVTEVVGPVKEEATEVTVKEEPSAGSGSDMDMDDDDRMSLSSISSGENKLEVTVPPPFPDLSKPPPPLWVLPNFQGGGQPVAENPLPVPPPVTPQEEAQEKTILGVLEQVVKELKLVIHKDMCKRMVQNSAFKQYDAWWEAEENKGKTQKPLSKAEMKAPAKPSTSSQSSAPLSKPEVASTSVFSMFDNKESSLGAPGFGMGGLLGLRAGMPKLPSFRRKFRPPSPPPMEDEDIRRPHTPPEDSDDESHKASDDEFGVDVEEKKPASRKHVIYSSDSESESDKSESEKAESEDDEEEEEEYAESIGSSDEDEESEESGMETDDEEEDEEEELDVTTEKEDSQVESSDAEVSVDVVSPIKDLIESDSIERVSVKVEEEKDSGTTVEKEKEQPQRELSPIIEVVEDEPKEQLQQSPVHIKEEPKEKIAEKVQEEEQNGAASIELAARSIKIKPLKERSTDEPSSREEEKLVKQEPEETENRQEQTLLPQHEICSGETSLPHIDSILEKDAALALLQMHEPMQQSPGDYIMQDQELNFTPKHPVDAAREEQRATVQHIMDTEHNYFAPIPPRVIANGEQVDSDVTDSASEGEPARLATLPLEIQIDHNYCVPVFPDEVFSKKKSKRLKDSPTEEEQPTPVGLVISNTARDYEALIDSVIAQQHELQEAENKVPEERLLSPKAEPEIEVEIEKVSPMKETKKKKEKKLKDVTNLRTEQNRELASILPPPKPRPEYKLRNIQEEIQLRYEFLLHGIDQEDVMYLKRRYEELLGDDSPQTYWLNDTHWVDHTHTNITDPEPPKKKRKHSHYHADEYVTTSHKTGCARTEGYYKITHQEKAKYLSGVRGIQQETVLEGAEKLMELAEERKKKQQSNREARSETRRIQNVLTSMGEDLGELLKFNQLKFRKKHMKFAKSGIHDWGLFALEPIAAEEMVIEYVGQSVRHVVADKREKHYEATGIGSSYLFRVDHDTIIDATKCGNLARFINHSCNPNCYAKIITVDSKRKIVIYSKRDIDVNEEITYDYKFPIEEEKITCLCMSHNCRGTLN